MTVHHDCCVHSVVLPNTYGRRLGQDSKCPKIMSNAKQNQKKKQTKKNIVKHILKDDLIDHLPLKNKCYLTYL